MRLLLRVTCRYFVAGAEFEKRDGSWVIVRCAPNIKESRHIFTNAVFNLYTPTNKATR